MNPDCTPAVYLDHAAASPPLPHTLDLFCQYAAEYSANQEAIHQAAYQIRKKIQESEELVLDSLCGSCNHAFVQWTDSGTAAFCNMFAHHHFRDGEVVTTAAEHAALTAALKRLGVTVRHVRLEQGLIDEKHLAELLSPATRLVAIHHVQSETGALQDLTAIRRIIDLQAPQSLFLADTVQSAAKLNIPWQEAGLDFATVSGYKVGTPGGGALIVRDREIGGEKLSAFFQRLRKEEHLLSRPNPAMCMTLAQTVAEMTAAQDRNLQHISELNRRLRASLRQLFDSKIRFVAPESSTSPYILHFMLPGYQGAVLVRMLSEQRIYIASGSACNAETQTPSPALLASGIKPRDAFSGLRVSFSPATTANDISRLIASLEDCIHTY